MSKVLSAAVLCLCCCVIFIMQVQAANPASYTKAVSDYNAGKYSIALAEFEYCKTAFPNNALVRYYAALCAQNLGRFDKARAEFEWVAQNGDAKLKSMAQTGLSQLARAHQQSASHSSHSTASTQVASASGAQPKSKVKRVLDFYADWCGPCKQFAPVFEAVKSRMRDVSFESYNIDEESSHDIRSKVPPFNSIPHAVFMDGSGKVLFSGSPARSVEDFERQISEFR